MSDSIVNDKFGYVEDAKCDTDYKNLDYRDTLTPLWSSLKDIQYNNVPFLGEQCDINLAICATIIQLSNAMNENFSNINKKLEKIEKRLKRVEQYTYNQNPYSQYIEKSSF